MNSLYSILKAKGYSRTKLSLTKTNHLEIEVILNHTKGTFIVDTGASNSCLGFEAISKFNLESQQSSIKAAGAGSTDISTELSKNNHIQINKWKKGKLSLILFDLQHVNEALINHNATPVDGIIGADILKKGKAVIDYSRNYLYMK